MILVLDAIIVVACMVLLVATFELFFTSKGWGENTKWRFKK